jgi:hypothetical protein
MTNPRNHSRLSTLVVVVFPILSLLASAQNKKEFSYTVGSHAVISITNNYGPITIKPSRSRQVVITTVSYSEDVSLENEQHGSRFELRSTSPHEGSGLVVSKIGMLAGRVPSASAVGIEFPFVLSGSPASGALSKSANATNGRPAAMLD